MKFQLIKKKQPVDESFKVNFFIKIIGSGLFTGYIPIASGTFGALVGLIFFVIPGFEHTLTLFMAVIISFFAGVYVSEIMQKRYGDDASEIVIDEVSGMWFTLLVCYIFIDLFLSHFKPLNANERDAIQLTQIFGIPIEITIKRTIGIVCFLLFRFFDIAKFPPANYADQMISGWGVMLDDIIAGLYAGILASVISHFVWYHWLFKVFINTHHPS